MTQAELADRVRRELVGAYASSPEDRIMRVIDFLALAVESGALKFEDLPLPHQKGEGECPVCRGRTSKRPDQEPGVCIECNGTGAVGEERPLAHPRSFPTQHIPNQKCNQKGEA